MNCVFLKDPFPHIVVDNYFTEKELSDVWGELHFLSANNKLLAPENTGSAFRTDRESDSPGEKIMLKNNRGIWLDTLYTDRSFSDILTHTRKMFAEDFISEAMKYHWTFKYLKTCNIDTTLVSYYEDGGYYLPHEDSAILTALIHLFKTPKCFIGGELIFPEYNYNYGLEHNRFILFPSIITHAVNEIKLKTNAPYSGRYTLTQFVFVR